MTETQTVKISLQEAQATVKLLDKMLANGELSGPAYSEAVYETMQIIDFS